MRVSTDIGSNKCQIHSTLLLLSLNIMIKWHQEVHIKKSLLASGGFKWHQEVQLLTHFLYFLKMAPKSYPLGKNFDFWVFWLKAATVWTAMLSRVQQSKNHTDRLRLTPRKPYESFEITFDNVPYAKVLGKAFKKSLWLQIL